MNIRRKPNRTSLISVAFIDPNAYPVARRLGYASGLASNHPGQSCGS